MSRIQEALQIAFAAHEGQKRKISGAPFIVHIIEVMRLLLWEGANEDLIIAGILHDVLEDTDYNRKELGERFGQRVLSLVEFCTEAGNQATTSDEELTRTWRERKERTITSCNKADKEELLIELADKLANLSSIRDDLIVNEPAVWESFHASKEELEWYFRELGKVFSRRLAECRLTPLYERALKDIFG